MDTSAVVSPLANPSLVFERFMQLDRWWAYSFCRLLAVDFLFFEERGQSIHHSLRRLGQDTREGDGPVAACLVGVFVLFEDRSDQAEFPFLGDLAFPCLVYQ
jgi:hypothetical protein